LFPLYRQYNPSSTAHLSPGRPRAILTSKMPTYSEMVVEALLALKERTGSSSPAIKKHMTTNNKDLAFAPHQLRIALKKGVESGKLIKIKGSYKLSPEAKIAAKKPAKAPVPKKPAVKKPVAKKPVAKKPTPKKTAPKKASAKPAAKKPAPKKSATPKKKPAPKKTTVTKKMTPKKAAPKKKAAAKK
ncbi:unnamed protein product, partial [Discosporangium mesarthrocarpum]